MSPPSYICVFSFTGLSLKYSKPLESHIFHLKRLPQLLKELYLYLVFMFVTTIPNHLPTPVWLPTLLPNGIVLTMCPSDHNATKTIG